MAKNQHRNLTGDALHNPKGFDGASNGTKPVKDGAGALDWITETQLPKALDYVSAQSAPPTEVAGDVYLIDTTGTAYDINTIAWQSGNTIRIAFNGSPDLSAVAADDYFITSGNGNSSNDGTFIITTVNDGSDYIEITNNDRSDATDDEATDAVGTGYYTLAEWDAVSKVSHVTFDGSIWSSITPSEGQSCYDVALGAIRVFDGTDWSSSLATGGISGSGTTNYLARWTPSGSALGNSVIQDDGTQVHVGGTPTSSTMLKVTPVDKYGIYVDSDQNTSSVISAYIADIANTGTGDIQSFYSTSAGSNDASANVSLFHSNGVTAGTQANSYGLYLTAHTAGTAKWGIYQAGANDKNYFAGAMQFDTAAAATGYVWTATDADGNGDWAAASGGGGGGDVSKVGTPVDNQIGVWTGDGTIEGDASLTWDASTLLVKGSGTGSGTSSFKTTDSADTTTLEVKDDGRISAYGKYLEVADDTTANTLGTFINQSIIIGDTITAGGASGSISNSMALGHTITIGNTSNINDSLFVGRTLTVGASDRSIVMGNAVNIADAEDSFVAGKTITGTSANLVKSFIFNTATSLNLPDTSYTGLTLIGSSQYGFEGSNTTAIGGDHYSTDDTLSQHYAFGDNIRGTVDRQTVIGMGANSGAYLQVASGAANGVHFGVASSRTGFGLVKATAKSLTTTATETTGLMYLGTGLPVALNVANTGDGAFWIENVDTAPSATVANAGALYNDSDYLTWTKSIKSTGQIGSSAGATPNTETPSGTTETIDWDNGNYQVLDLESASGNVTLTLSNPVAGFAYFIEIRQDSTTPLDVIFPSSVKFAGETAPYTLDVSTGANAVDAVSLAWNGSEYIASFSQNHG